MSSFIEKCQQECYDNYNCDVKINVVDLLKPFSMQYETYGKNKIFSVWTRAHL